VVPEYRADEVRKTKVDKILYACVTSSGVPMMPIA